MADAGTVLLADDEEAFRQSTAELLRREGFHCDTAADGAEALTRIGTSSYDVLVADDIVFSTAALEAFIAAKAPKKEEVSA